MGGGGCCIGNCCIVDCGFCCIFDTTPHCGDCGYTPPRPTTPSHAEKIANELAAMREKGSNAAQKDEAEVLETINTQMMHFIDELKKINDTVYGGKKLNINIKDIEKNNENLKKEVIGFIGNQLDNRLVLTDKDLSLILGEPDDAKRKKRFDEFYKDVRKKAMLALVDKIKSTIQQQSDKITTTINNRLKEVTAGMEEARTEYIEICNIKERQGLGLEKKQIDYMYQYTLCDIILEHTKHAAKKNIKN